MFGHRSFFCVLTTILILLEPVVTDIRRDCRKETRVSWVALRRIKSGDFEQNDPRLKCYFKCFMARNGILDGNAEIDVQRALRHLPRSLQHSSKKLFNECKSILVELHTVHMLVTYTFSGLPFNKNTSLVLAGTDHCDKAFEIVKCYVKHHPEILHSVPFL